MPQAFQNPIGGFTEGFLGGAKLGLQIQEQQVKVKARLAEVQKEQFTRAKASASIAMDIYGNKLYSKKSRLEAYNQNIVPFMNQYIVGDEGKGLSVLDDIPDYAEEITKRVKGIEKLEKEGKITADDARSEIINIMGEYEGQHEEFLAKKAGLFKEKGEREREEAEPLTLTERKAEAFGRLSDEEQEAVLQKAGVSVSIDLGKATKTDIDKQIIAGQKIIGQLNRIEATFKSEYLTYVGKGVGAAQKFADKLGLGTGTQFLEERSRWFNQAKQAFFVYRKWVTGVAGGEKEMADIAKAFADPERNSPAEYLANLKETRLWKRAVDKWLRETKVQGLSIGETREIMEQGEVGSAFGGEDLSGLSDEELMNRL